MDNALLMIGRLAGILGALLCLASGIARLAGIRWIGTFEALTGLQAGIAGMVLGCFCLLLALSKGKAR